MDDSNSFVVVANRLPVDMTVHPDGSYSISPSPGGLVTGLSPVLEQHRGCWVGWPGTVDVAPEPFRTDTGVLLHPVVLTASDYEGFYEGFSNATLWPLFHDLIVTPVYNTDWWHAFREVNLKFAEAVSQVAAHGATVWVQDYQLLLVPGILRQMRPDLKIGFFLHIPFPSPDLFRQLPWREEIVRGMLGADLVGFHLVQNAENFLALTQQVAALPGLMWVSRTPCRSVVKHWCVRLALMLKPLTEGELASGRSRSRLMLKCLGRRRKAPFLIF